MMEEMVFLTIVPRLTEAVMTNEFVNAGSVKRYDSVCGIALHDPITSVSFFLRFLGSLETSVSFVSSV